MDALGWTREDGADFSGMVTDRDDIIEFVFKKNRQIFGKLIADIDTHLSHGKHSVRVERGGGSPSAEDLETIASQMF